MRHGSHQLLGRLLVPDLAKPPLPRALGVPDAASLTALIPFSGLSLKTSTRRGGTGLAAIALSPIATPTHHHSLATASAQEHASDGIFQRALPTLHGTPSPNYHVTLPGKTAPSPSHRRGFTPSPTLLFGRIVNATVLRLKSRS